MAQPLKILWLSHFVPYPPAGGALQRTFNLLRHAARRHDVHLVALNQRALLPDRAAVADAVRALSTLCPRVEVFPMRWDRSVVHRVVGAATSMVRSTPYWQNWLQVPAMHQYLRRLAASDRFDLIHADIIGLLPYTRPFRGIPLVLNHHNVESQMARRRATQEPGTARRIFFTNEAAKLERLERRAAPRVALNLTVSELDRERLLQVSPRARVEVIENGVDVDYFKSNGDQPQEGLVFAGLLSWYPNRAAVRYLLQQIWPALLADGRERRLTIVGRDPPPELLAAARDPRVSAPGAVPDVRPFLDAAAVYVCPIFDGGGTRLKILDALAMAKAVVASGLAVEGLGLDDGRHYLRAETPQQFVEQIRRLEGDPGLRAQLGQAGRQFVVQRYSWDVIGPRLNQCYAIAARRDGSAAGVSGKRAP